MRGQGSGNRDGFALIAVLVVLSLLLGLAAPFALSMGRGEAVAFHQVDEKQVDWGSGSVRDQMLSAAARGHPSVDPSPTADGLDEYPSHLVLPEAFADLSQDGQLLLAGEVWDLQRRVNLNTASPLMLANLLDLATRLREEVPPEGAVLEVERADGFPDEGFLLVDGELIHYGGRTQNAFTNLSRGLFVDFGFRPATDHTIPQEKLVLDYRTVLAVTWPFDERHGGNREQRVPYGSVEELARIEEARFGGFTPRELDVLRAHGTVASDRQGAASWGRAERVFNRLQPPVGNEYRPRNRTLRVRSGFHMGAGSVVRIRNLETGAVEHGLVIATQLAAPGDSALNLESIWDLQLLKPVTQEFPATDTVVEPLVTHPVNINTASVEVLDALMREMRGTRFQLLRPGVPNVPAPRVGRAEARQLALRIAALRGGTPDSDPAARPFDSWEDLVKRLFAPLLEDADDNQRRRLVLLYRNLLIGRDGEIDMGTAPICFTSGDAVGYRAAAAYQRGRAAQSTAARLERRGIAVAMPGHALDMVWATQQTMEQAFRLDRNAPWYLTRPVNTSAQRPADRGTNPGPRYFPHLMAEVYPGQGYGQGRYPSRAGDNAGFRSAPASVEPAAGVYTHESFPSSLIPEGWDVEQEGTTEFLNSGPGALSTGPVELLPSTPGQQSFPFTTGSQVTGAGGQAVTSRHAVSFWITLRDLGDQMIYDLSGEESERNRISVQIREGELRFEVLDEAGVDPQPGLTGTAPDRSAGAWRVPLVDLGLRPEVPVHLNFSAYGNGPGQLSLLVDGVPRGDPDLVTYLTRAVDPYEPDGQFRVPSEDIPRFVELHVESTDGFPDRGVLRVGLELFEYTSRGDTTFYCEFRDSTGGRAARMSVWEYGPEMKEFVRGRGDERGPDHSRAIGELSARGVQLDAAPGHSAGAAVALYGYSIPLYRDSFVQVGNANLADALGAFAVARVANDPAPTIVVTGPSPPIPPETRTVGVGLNPETTDDIVLGDPLVSPNYPPPVDPRIPSAFPASGGYALLVQRQVLVRFTVGRLTGEERIGGIEVIRYAARQGNRLTGIQRRVTLPGIAANDPGIPLNHPEAKFVSDWDGGMGAGQGAGTPLRDLPHYLLYVVPISIAVIGDVTDPSALGYSEWVQIYPQGDEASTEWVRYNLIMDGRNLVRSNLPAWSSTYSALTFGALGALDVLEITNLGGAIGGPGITGSHGRPRTTGNYIGYLDQIEEDFPSARAARQALGFRGDPFTRTTSHAHAVNTAVLPVHRLEMDSGNYASLWGRTGRNDRVALVNGSRASGGLRPTVEWHSVNWAVRQHFGDWNDRTDPPEPGAPIDPTLPPLPPAQALPERLGLYPFQLVAFKERVGAALFQGPGDRSDDPQFVDRLVKFPSGELPGAYSERAVFGGSQQGDGRNLLGTLDELVALQHQVGDLLLDQPMAETAQEFVVRTDLELFGFGPVVGEGTRPPPDLGGLVVIDNEIIAYTSQTNGRFRVAVDGRGLLDTEPRAHDEGAGVHFLTHVPAAILSEGITALDHRIAVDAMGDLPRFGGALLVGRTELLHYTWSRGRTILEMPRWFDKERNDIRGRGLFRARFGTQAVGAAAGEAVILFPFRYWDRSHDRADDPEMAYFQLTHGGSAPVLFTEFGWQEEAPDPAVDLHALLRVDGKGSFADDPERNPDLFLFTEADDQDRAFVLFRQGSTVETRFFTVYGPSAFDSVNFLAHGWKTAPLVRGVLLGYEGDGRILEEVTGR